MKILFHPKAAKFLKKVDKEIKERILKKIKRLKENKNLGKHLRYSNFRSLRIGDYRAIYEIEKNKIITLFIGHRKNVYEDFSKLF
ncbi:MAG: type II toxin-antitoxin system RelE/ParE family toxin [Nanoarchaeota archaeon]|nr:type II toxin-antitoxin system RelE/ParE family toxin [Nanoarchaeota archaeon]